jgi:hypothetical protein
MKGFPEVGCTKGTQTFAVVFEIEYGILCMLTCYMSIGRCSPCLTTTELFAWINFVIFSSRSCFWSASLSTFCKLLVSADYPLGFPWLLACLFGSTNTTSMEQTLAEKKVVYQLRNFVNFYWTKPFITVCTIVGHWTMCEQGLTAVPYPIKRFVTIDCNRSLHMGWHKSTFLSRGMFALLFHIK